MGHLPPKTVPKGPPSVGGEGKQTCRLGVAQPTVWVKPRGRTEREILPWKSVVHISVGGRSDITISLQGPWFGGVLIGDILRNLKSKGNYSTCQTKFKKKNTSSLENYDLTETQGTINKNQQNHRWCNNQVKCKMLRLPGKKYWINTLNLWKWKDKKYEQRQVRKRTIVKHKNKHTITTKKGRLARRLISGVNSRSNTVKRELAYGDLDVKTFSKMQPKETKTWEIYAIGPTRKQGVKGNPTRTTQLPEQRGEGKRLGSTWRLMNWWKTSIHRSSKGN